MNFYNIYNIVISFSILLFGIFVFFKSKEKVRFPFVLFALTGFIWLFFYSMSYLSAQYFLCMTYLKIGYSGVLFIFPTAYHQVALFIKKYSSEKNSIIISYLFSFVCLLLIWNTDLLIADKPYHYFWGYYPHSALFHPIFLIIVNFVVCRFLWMEIKQFFFNKGLSLFERSKLKYLLFATLAFTFSASDFLQNYGIELLPIGNIFVLVFVVIMAYAILKYRLMDISVVFTRAGVFVAVYSLVLGVPFTIAFGWQENLVKIFGINWWIIPLVSSTALATVGPFIYLYIQKKAEDRLLREQRAYQNILRNASSGMIRIKHLKKLLNVVVHVITKTVRIKHAAIYLLDKETNNFVLQAARGRVGADKQENFIDAGSPLVWQLTRRKNPILTEEAILRLRDDPVNQGLIKLVEQLVKLGVSLVVPSSIDDRLIGILMLGEKASRKLYSEDDLVVFSVLANQAALAIENAQFYDEVKRTHEQLFQAEKMATIGTMADGLSHQINNRFHALSLISGDALDILKSYDGSNCSDETKQVLADLKSALARIEANVLQGGEVVKGLLKYSRPGEGGYELIDFKDVLGGTIDMVQYKIKLKEIDLVQNIPLDLPKLYGNLTQLQEVFFNLIDNAYDATKERQVTLKEEGYRSKIEVSASSVNGSIEIKVSDNGMGVKDLDRKKLFTPFFTTKATAKKGTGLGLYVIDKIVSAHNGKIAIDSIYRSGTRFTITLPISPKS